MLVVREIRMDESAFRWKVSGPRCGLSSKGDSSPEMRFAVSYVSSSYSMTLVKGLEVTQKLCFDLLRVYQSQPHLTVVRHGTNLVETTVGKLTCSQAIDGHQANCPRSGFREF
jgi:hypothetical protein